MGVHQTTEFINRVWDAQDRPTDEKQHAFLAFFDDDHVFTENRLERPRQTKGVLPPHGAVDIYFAPCLFRRKRRRNEYALPGKWLYADLDESDPRKLNHLPPTVAWETSRGRYQCLWKLTEALPPDKLAFLNQRTTYFTDADHGGWSLTKVLRVPGSISTKHGDDFVVRLMWWKEDLAYDPKDIHTLVRGMRVPKQSYLELKDVKFPKAPPERIVRRFRIPPRAKKLIRATEARGDRSERLWALYVDLLGAGMKPEQVFVVVRPTVWNKYRGQKREIPQLWSEINKAAIQTAGKPGRRNTSSSKDSNTEQNTTSSETPKRKKKSSSKRKKSSTSSRNPLPDFDFDPEQDLDVPTFSEFMSKKLKRPGWAVESIWSEGAHGFLTGEAKAYKSVISCDLAISVASGTPFLNTFAIPATGTVLMIQEENDEGEFQDRMHRIITSRGLGAEASFTRNGSGDHLKFKPTADLPIIPISNRQFNLLSGKHLMWLQGMIKKYNIKLIILDPFYLMTPGVAENEQAQVTPVLKRLLQIKQRFGVGIQIIHHYKKQNVMAPTHGAARMSGTSVFHRWFESAVYVEKTEDPTTVRLIPDHRGHAPQGAMRVSFDLGSADDSEYNVYVHQAKADKAMLHTRFREIMKDHPDGYFDGMSNLRKAMGLSSSAAVKSIARDQGFRIVTQKTGLRGRPQLVILPPTKNGKIDV